MIRQLMTGAIAAILLSATTASAATLSLIGTGQTQLVTGNDIVPSLNSQTINFIDGAAKTASNGLFLDTTGGAEVTYTFLGGEAGHRNFAAVNGRREFFNNGGRETAAGTEVSITQSVSGLLDFAFGTTAPSWARGIFQNNGLARTRSDSIDPYNFAMGFVQLSATAFYVLFDDIAAGDRDFDDMAIRIDVAAVPLPAGGLLLLSGLGGALLLRRRKKLI